MSSRAELSSDRPRPTCVSKSTGAAQPCAAAPEAGSIPVQQTLTQRSPVVDQDGAGLHLKHTGLQGSMRRIYRLAVEAFSDALKAD